jgi:FixJ family two-component response regulator
MQARVVKRDVDETDSIVIVIDDDPSFRRSIERLIRSMGYAVRSFGTTTEFLGSQPADVPTSRWVPS